MAIFREHLHRSYHLPTYPKEADLDFWGEQLEQAEAWAKTGAVSFEWVEEAVGRFRIHALGERTHLYIEPDEVDRRIAEADFAFEFYSRNGI